jgi:PAS domain S-box-containing protein
MTFDPARFSNKLAREMPDAVIYADGEGIIQIWNHGAERIFGYAEREALGYSLDTIVPENLRQRHWMGYQKKCRRARRGTARATCSLCRRSGRMARAYRSSDARRMVGIAALLRDVTRRFEEISSSEPRFLRSKNPSGASQQSE